MTTMNMALVGCTVAFVIGTWAIIALLKEIDNLRDCLKIADKRYDALVLEYHRECASNPTRPRITTFTTAPRDYAITQTWEPRDN